MFKVDRIFSCRNPKIGIIEWYFQAREGNVGPYHSKQQADFMLKKFIQTCIELGYWGGRKEEDKYGTLHLQIQNFLNYEVKGEINWF